MRGRVLVVGNPEFGESRCTLCRCSAGGCPLPEGTQDFVACFVPVASFRVASLLVNASSPPAAVQTSPARVGAKT